MTAGLEVAFDMAFDDGFDVVQVLGKELRHEPERAMRELRARSAAAAVARGRAPVLTLEAPLRGQPEAGSAIVVRLLGALGVPRGAVIAAAESRSTREEAVGLRRRAAQRGWRRALVLTSRYHVARAQWIFDDVLGRQRVTVRPPEALLDRATGEARDWIEGGTPDADVLAREGRVEQRFRALAAALGPLPAPVRWSLEIGAATALRARDEALLRRGR